ncbi:hypothetical protein R1flu_026083 [Riccia fluitans]|uniref:Uncharacterized protein n=1 Tax=Riccia fluitans TaxID=41844 RepID=A0ABD1XFD8_9MARC
MVSAPQWLRATGCYIAREGEPIQYLGFPIGWNVPESQLLNFITGKLERKLGNWAYRLLTFEGRLIVLKHIGDAQKLRQVLRMVHHPGEDWMLALGALLKWMIVKRQWAVTMRDWEVEEILMAKCPNSISGAKTATGLLKVWAKAKTRLELLRKDFTPQGEMSTEVAIVIGEQQGWFTTVKAKEIKAILRKHKVKMIGQWTDWASWNDARRPLPQREQMTVENLKPSFHCHLFSLRMISTSIGTASGSVTVRIKGGRIRDLGDAMLRVSLLLRTRRIELRIRGRVALAFVV